MCQLKSKFGQPLIATLSSLLLRSNEGLTLSSILSAVAEFVSKAANRRQNDISSFSHEWCGYLFYTFATRGGKLPRPSCHWRKWFASLKYKIIKRSWRCSELMWKLFLSSSIGYSVSIESGISGLFQAFFFLPIRKQVKCNVQMLIWSRLCQFYRHVRV